MRHRRRSLRLLKKESIPKQSLAPVHRPVQEISPLPFLKRERIQARDFLLLGLIRSKGASDLSTPHLSPLLDRGGEETLTASDANTPGLGTRRETGV
jgi:hypothetical protein